MDNLNENIGFTVDAALIMRLGYELVGKAETAVSELIKNAYDADARVVNVYFEDTDQPGGTITISDDGLGMTYDQLKDGFMRISSADKVRNPFSCKYSRARAGRKGIGRFATQRLGNTLIIVTQTHEEDKAIKLTINWEQYQSGLDITDITFPIEYIDKKKDEGTDLIIIGTKDTWNEAGINRVNRYVMDLFQPDYLSTDNKNRNDNTFQTNFFITKENNTIAISNQNINIYDKAIAIFEGEITDEHKGNVIINSTLLDVHDNEILTDQYGKEKEYMALSRVKFKVYYFIYNRIDYYQNTISKQDLNAIKSLSNTASGVKLYRNGFRVLPYGEATDDWTNINRRWTGESGVNIPLSTKNLFGYVELVDADGQVFDETSSREGLIENDAFKELTDFISVALVFARRRIASSTKLKEIKNQTTDITESRPEKTYSTFEKIANLTRYYEEFKNYYSRSSSEEERNQYEKSFAEVKSIIDDLKDEIDEMEMLRVLAALGLTIGEFTHEIKQYRPAVYSNLHTLSQYILHLPQDAKDCIESLKKEFDNLFSYTSYFDTSISQNLDRKLISLDMLEVLDNFECAIKENLNKNDFDFNIDIHNYDVVTVPMHRTEWSSVLYNLYTNSRKAIIRANTKGKINIEIGIEEDNIYIKFEDNGDGIPEDKRNKIFNAFFSTSTPASYDAPESEQLTGTGLGLKIVKDIILSYNGEIYVDEPDDDYNTCIKIIIPRNK